MLCIYGRYKNLILSKLIEFAIVYNVACPSITSSTTSCLSATSKLLHLFGVYSKLINSIGSCPPPPPPPPNKPTPLNVYYIS